MVEDNFNRFVQMLNMAWKLLLEHHVRRPNMQLVLSFLERFMNLIPPGETKIETVPIYINFPYEDKSVPIQPYIYNWNYGNNTAYTIASEFKYNDGHTVLCSNKTDSNAEEPYTTLSSNLASTLSQQGFNIGYDKKKREWYAK
jgi:hypothetical protein